MKRRKLSQILTCTLLAQQFPVLETAGDELVGQGEVKPIFGTILYSNLKREKW